MIHSGYYPDLSKFSIDQLKRILQNIRLLPSQKIIGEDIDNRFACLARNGIDNLQQLQDALKTKAAVHTFAVASELPVDYLTILRREVNSYQPKPIKLSDFPGINPQAIRKLDQIKITNTRALFPHVLTRRSRSAFAETNQIDPEDILELTRLTDVARLKWVGPKFARLLIESEYDTVEKIADSDYEELDLALARVNAEKRIYKGVIGLEDLKQWVNIVVPIVPQIIQY
jgi:hypothetical protein